MVEIRTGARVIVPTPEGERELDWEGEWIADFPYEPGDVVYRDGSSYRAFSANQGVDPLAGTPEWEYLAREGAQGPPGPPGEQGEPGVGQTIEFEFQFPVHEWVANHGLGAYPAATALDAQGRVINGETEYSDANTIKVRFFANNQPIVMAGKLVLN